MGGIRDGYAQNTFKAIPKEFIQMLLLRKRTQLKDAAQHPLDHGLLCNGVFPSTYRN